MRKNSLYEQAMKPVELQNWHRLQIPTKFNIKKDSMRCIVNTQSLLQGRKVFLVHDPMLWPFAQLRMLSTMAKEWFGFPSTKPMCEMWKHITLKDSNMCKIKQAKIINSTRDYTANIKKAYVIRYNHIYIYIVFVYVFQKNRYSVYRNVYVHSFWYSWIIYPQTIHPTSCWKWQTSGTR